MKITLALLLVASAASANTPPPYSGCYYLWSTNAYTSSATTWCAHTGNDSNSGCGGTDLDMAYAYKPLTPSATPTLLLFLPGRGSRVEGYQRFMQKAAEKGYYVVGLPYLNGHPSDDMCGYHGECYGQLYDQIVDGDDRSFYAGIQPQIMPSTNSISYRLHQFLAFMKANHYCQDFDWLQFWDAANDHPKWSKIVVAGHSHGGEVTTWITKNKPVIAGITFEAPYANLDSGASDGRGGPTLGPDRTPYLADCPALMTCKAADVAADYLTAGSWQNKLYVTLSDQDNGYDLVPGWPGHYMWNAAHTIGKTEQLTPYDQFPTTSLNNHHWWTVQGTAGTGCNNGHTATITDDCVSVPDQNWLIKYWGVVLQSALP